MSVDQQDPYTGKQENVVSARQTSILVMLGIAFWFAAAMLVRFIAPMGALDGNARILTYALVIPGTASMVIVIRKLAGLRRIQTGYGVMIVTAIALLFDGIAHAWFPMLYGPDPALHVAGAAIIFWGAGVGLVLGLLMSRPT